MKNDLYKEGYTQNREISWLHFDDRCLNEAKDKTVPLAERLKFVSIYTSNLTEFFMVRVGSLYDLAKASVVKTDHKSGMTPQQQLDAIYPMAKRGCAKRDTIFEDIRRKMNKAGVEDVPLSECTKTEIKFLKKYFRDRVAPLLAPQIVDIRHPFPNLQSGVIYIAALLKYKGYSVFGFVPVPSAVPAVIQLPAQDKVRFIHTEDLIEYFIQEIFPDSTVAEIMKLMAARSAYLDPEDEEFDEILDYRKKMIKVLKERRKMHVTMLVCSKKPSSVFKKYLLSHLGITNRSVFVTSAPLNLKYAFSLEKMMPEEIRKTMVFEPYEPKLTPQLDYSKKLLPQVMKKDVLLSYPYDSMEPFLQLVRESASDPDVVSIKMTAYRLASNARLINYLCQAAENGKEVDVLIELKARFDEQNNIDYSEMLEDSGVNVIYGFETYKVHSKICLITAIKEGVPVHAALVATGNFNENTARQYTDLAVMTGNPRITKDAVAFFKNMAIGKLDGRYRNLLVAPVSLKSTVLSLIERETAKGDKGMIFAKVNAVTDEEIIHALKEASCAGVKVTMIVRGISCILPGIEGKTENIEIRSVVGRYLEHSRIYIFGTGVQEKMYIASADFMTRNTENRVEIALPVLDKDIRKKIHAYVDTYLADNTKARQLMPNGRYHKIASEEEPFNAQEELMRTAPSSRQTIHNVQHKTARVFATVYKEKK